MQSPGQAVLKPTALNEGILDVAQMATGVALILFMWSHMMLVASVNLGSGVMNAIGKFLEDHYLAQAGGPAVALLFLLHFALAARKIPFRASGAVGHVAPQPPVPAHRHLAVGGAGRHRNGHPGNGMHPHVDGADEFAHHGGQECLQDPGGLVAAVLHGPAPDGGAPCGHRPLPHRREMGFCHEPPAQLLQEPGKPASPSPSLLWARSPCSPSMRSSPPPCTRDRGLRSIVGTGM